MFGELSSLQSYNVLAVNATITGLKCEVLQLVLKKTTPCQELKETIENTLKMKSTLDLSVRSTATLSTASKQLLTHYSQYTVGKQRK